MFTAPRSRFRAQRSTVVLVGVLLLAVVPLAGCSSTTAGAPAARTPSTSTAARASPTPTPTPTGLDVDSDRQWRSGCVLPLSQMARLAAPVAMTITSESDASVGDAIDCGYDDPVSGYGIDVQIDAYGSTTEGYGFLTGGDGHSWQAPDATTGAKNACASTPEPNDGPIRCTSAGASRIVSNWGTAVVFTPGRYFYVIGADSIAQTAQVGDVLLRVGLAVENSADRPQ